MFLFEMSKNISFRNIDRNLWLSVSSMCSRNKDTEAEFVKPYGTTKNDMNDQIQRYVAALLIMKKPCPKTEQDIDKIKTYKLIGHHAIELGATIEDIQSCYDINSGKSTTSAPIKKQAVEEPKRVTTHAQAPVRAKRGKIQLKYMDKLNAMIAHVSPSIYLKVSATGPTSEKPVYKAAKADIENYIYTAIKKSHQNVDEFAQYILKDFSNFYKIIPHDRQEYLSIYFYIGESHGGWHYYNKWFHFDIMPDTYKMYINYYDSDWSSKNRDSWDEDKKDNNLLKNDITKYVPPYSNDVDRDGYIKKVNVLDKFSEYIFDYIVAPMIKIKAEEQCNVNIGNSAATLAKYHMTNITSNYMEWLSLNIKSILKNNPNTFISARYGDWCGEVKGFKYDSKYNKYYVYVYMQSDHSDMDDEDELSNLIWAANKGRYSYDYEDDYEDYYCTVTDLEALAEKAYTNIKKLIETGKLV